MTQFRSPNCLFTETDYILVRQKIKTLTHKQTHILFLRFWGLMSIEEIASTLRMSWSAVDKLISAAFDEIKISCLADPRFSRNHNALNGERGTSPSATFNLTRRKYQ